MGCAAVDQLQPRRQKLPVESSRYGHPRSDRVECEPPSTRPRRTATSFKKSRSAPTFAAAAALRTQSPRHRGYYAPSPRPSPHALQRRPQLKPGYYPPPLAQRSPRPSIHSEDMVHSESMVRSGDKAQYQHHARVCTCSPGWCVLSQWTFRFSCLSESRLKRELPRQRQRLSEVWKGDLCAASTKKE